MRAMSESQVSTVIRMWAAVAWADGMLARAESESLVRLIRAAELTADEREQAMELLREPVELSEVFLKTLTPVSRRGVYRAACKMAMVDQVLAPAERWMLDRLRDMLELTEEDAREIEAEVPIPEIR
jgi:uncharacterized membrane protein YebE (DUF533 family)